MSILPEASQFRDSKAIELHESPRTRILIIGGGFGGVAAARALRHAEADVMLIDRRNHHVFQPLLYQAATAIVAPADIAAPLRQIEVEQRNLNVVLGEVVDVDVGHRTVVAMMAAGRRERFGFDFLVVATGASPSYFGHDEFAPHAPALKTLSDADNMRGKILTAFEVAETTDNEQERAKQMTFVLVGAGPTGVELAASLAEMVRVTLRGNFRRIDPAAARIILIDGAKRILPTFGEPISRKAEARLKHLGVTILTGTNVETVDGTGVVAGGRRIDSATVLWTAGVAASPLVKSLGAETDHAGRALVGPDLQLVGAQGIFVIGDAASVVQNERPVPGVAQAAIQEGRYVGRMITRQLKGKEPTPPFRYFDKGNMAVVGTNFALLERGSFRTSGFLTWLIWAFIHILSLPQPQNRFRVQRQWLWSYFTGQRSSRVINEPDRKLA